MYTNSDPLKQKYHKDKIFLINTESHADKVERKYTFTNYIILSVLVKMVPAVVEGATSPAGGSSVPLFSS